MSTTDFSKTPRFFELVMAAEGRDVAAQSAALERRAREVVPAANSLLDAACGAGAHLQALAATFATVAGRATELVPLQVARSRDGIGSLELGSIETLPAEPAYDVVLALDGAVAAARTKERLHASIARLAAARTPGGVLFIEPFTAPDDFVVGETQALFVDEVREKIARMIVTRRGAHLAILDYHYLIASFRGIERHFERIERGLYAAEAYERAFEAAGLRFESLVEAAFPKGLYRAT